MLLIEKGKMVISGFFHIENFNKELIYSLENIHYMKKVCGVVYQQWNVLIKHGLHWKFVKTIFKVALEKGVLRALILDKKVSRMKFNKRVIVVAKLGNTKKTCVANLRT